MKTKSAEVQRQLAPLEVERDRLLRGLADRSDDLYQSHGNVHIAHIRRTTSTAECTPLFYTLQLGSGNSSASSNLPAHQGTSTIAGPARIRLPGSSLRRPTKRSRTSTASRWRQRFYRQFSPESPTGFPMRPGETPTVRVGQYLARTTADPRTIYIVKFDRQAHRAQGVGDNKLRGGPRPLGGPRPRTRNSNSCAGYVSADKRQEFVTWAARRGWLRRDWRIHRRLADRPDALEIVESLTLHAGDCKGP